MDSAKTVVRGHGRLPYVILLLSGPIYLTKWWVAGDVALIASGATVLLGFFLFLQSVRLRLVFTSEAMELENRSAVVRSFPYKDWRSWRLFWEPFPILLYFREVNGIHFVPMIFDGWELREQLEQRLGHVNRATQPADAT